MLAGAVANGGDPAVEPPADRLGREIAVMLFESGWLKRRIESVELLSDAWVRWRTSIDCVIPRSLTPFGASAEGKPLYLLPVALLPKVPPALMRFDFDGEDGRLWLPLRRENGLASYAALLYAASRALEVAGPRQLPRQLREQLLFVATGGPEYAAPFARRLRAPRKGLPEIPTVEGMVGLEQAELELDRWVGQMMGLTRENPPEVEGEDEKDGQGELSWSELQELDVALARDEMSSWLLRNMAVASVVLAHVEEGRDRHKLVRLSYDAPIYKPREPLAPAIGSTLGWESVNLVIETPYVGAHSYHFEFVGTDGIEVFDSSLMAANGDRAEHYEQQDSNRVHHYWSDAASVDRITALVRLRVAQQNFVGPAFWASVAVAASVLVCGALAQPLVRHGTGAATLLLLFPGVAATLVGSTTRHPLTARVLRRAHIALLVSAMCAYATAGVLVFIHTGGGANAALWVRLVWLSLGLVALGPMALLYVARKLPRARAQEGRLERISRRLQRGALEMARRRARIRERRLRVMVEARGLDRERARELAEASSSSRRFFVTPRTLGMLGGKRVVLELHVEARRRRWLPRQLAMEVWASPGDLYISQPIEARRALSETALWLGRGLEEGYEFEARWRGALWRTRRLLGWAWWAMGGRERRKREPVAPVRVTVEQLAEELRGETALLNRRYQVEVVGDATVDTPATEGDASESGLERQTS